MEIINHYVTQLKSDLRIRLSIPFASFRDVSLYDVRVEDGDLIADLGFETDVTFGTSVMDSVYLPVPVAVSFNVYADISDYADSEAVECHLNRNSVSFDLLSVERRDGREISDLQMQVVRDRLKPVIRETMDDWFGQFVLYPRTDR